MSDGTAAGTRLVKDIVAGAGSPCPDNLTADGSVLLFSAFDPAHGRGGSGAATARRLGTRRLTGHRARAPSPPAPRLHRRGSERLLRGQRQRRRLRALGGAEDPTSSPPSRTCPPPTGPGAPSRRSPPPASPTGCGEGLFCAERTRHPGRDGGLPRPRPARRRLRAAAGHRHPLHRRPRLLLGRRLDRADRHRRRHPGVRRLAAPLLPGEPRSAARRDGDLPAPRPPRREPTCRRRPPAPASPTCRPAYWAAAWIEQLAAEGITNGCAVNLYCPNKRWGAPRWRSSWRGRSTCRSRRDGEALKESRKPRRAYLP